MPAPEGCACPAGGRREVVAASAARYLAACERLGWWSGAVLLARDGEVLFRGASGLADRERRIPNGPSTRFRIGSLTKPFTAFAVLELAARGRLDLERPVSGLVPELPAGSGITARHLLDHTSGIPDLVALEEGALDRSRSSSLRELVRASAARPLLFTPGSACSYSSSGYLVLAHLVETLTGTPFDRHLEETVLGPLGLSATRAWNRAPDGPDRAAGYTIDGSDLIPAAFRDPTTVTGCGGLESTVDDLFAWHRALLPGGPASGEDGRQDRPGPASSYLRGWRVSEAFGRRLLWHDGGIEGFASCLLGFVDDRACVVLLGNLEHAPGAEISRTLAAILLGEPFSVPTGREPVADGGTELAGLEGTYRFSPSFEAVVTREGNRLFFRGPRQPRFEAVAFAPDRFFLRASPAELSFARGRGGTAARLVLHQSGEHLVGARLEASGLSS